MDTSTTSDWTFYWISYECRNRTEPDENWTVSDRTCVANYFFYSALSEYLIAHRVKINPNKTKLLVNSSRPSAAAEANGSFKYLKYLFDKNKTAGKFLLGQLRNLRQFDQNCLIAFFVLLLGTKQKYRWSELNFVISGLVKGENTNKRSRAFLPELLTVVNLFRYLKRNLKHSNCETSEKSNSHEF